MQLGYKTRVAVGALCMLVAQDLVGPPAHAIIFQALYGGTSDAYQGWHSIALATPLLLVGLVVSLWVGPVRVRWVAGCAIVLYLFLLGFYTQRMMPIWPATLADLANVFRYPVPAQCGGLVGVLIGTFVAQRRARVAATGGPAKNESTLGR
jgi:hypothetical protein